MKKRSLHRSVVFCLLLFYAVFFTNCRKDKEVSQGKKTVATSSSVLKFLDEYVYPINQTFQGTTIGGLSGIDYANNAYYIVCDDSKNPRYYKTQINIEDKKIKNILFTDVVLLDKQEEYYSSHFLDLESIIFQNGNFVISSEGSIYRNKVPSVFNVNAEGSFVSEYTISNYFLTQTRHNGSFESLSRSLDNEGFWCANELPLKTDGTEAQHPETHSPVRFTYYDSNTKKAIKEFVYELEPLPFPKTLNHDINGVADILEYKKNQFLVIERAFQSKNIVKIFKATIEDNSTNSLNIDSLREATYIPMKKELLFDFNTIKSKLTDQTIDNIEGITFGDTLPNGNKTIIMVSDDNFQKFGAQINQFVLFELIENE